MTDWTEYEKLHKAAMEDVASDKSASINIHGKKYSPVSARVEKFRKHFGPNGRLRIAEQAETENGRLFMRAVVELRGEGEWIEVAEGRAEEQRGATAILKTSAVEVCETSAIGRALANFGLHGGEYASANEVQVARSQQGAGWGVHHPLGDVAPDDNAIKYADAFKEALANGGDVKAVHADLHAEGEELYRATWSLLDSKSRSAIKKLIA